MITPQERDEALKEELHYERFVQKIDQNALYVAEIGTAGVVRKNTAKRHIPKDSKFTRPSISKIRGLQRRLYARSCVILTVGAVTVGRKIIWI